MSRYNHGLSRKAAILIRNRHNSRYRSRYKRDGKICLDKIIKDYVPKTTACMKDNSALKTTYAFKSMYNDLSYLYENGRISSLDPSLITPDDVMAYYSMLKKGINHKHPLQERTMSTYLGKLNMILIQAGNLAAEEAKIEYASIWPRSIKSEPLPGYTKREVSTIYYYAMRASDFQTLMALTIAAFIASSGIRKLEALAMTKKDINLQDLKATVKHPKGSGSYGNVRDVPIHPFMTPIFKRYMKARRQYLMEENIDTNALFVSSHNYERYHGYLHDNTAVGGRLKASKLCKFVIDYKKCRRTYPQNLLDMHVQRDAVAKVMGHKPRTLDTSYAQKRRRDAVDEVIHAQLSSLNTEQGYNSVWMTGKGAG